MVSIVSPRFTLILKWLSPFGLILRFPGVLRTSPSSTGWKNGYPSELIHFPPNCYNSGLSLDILHMSSTTHPMAPTLVNVHTCCRLDRKYLRLNYLTMGQSQMWKKKEFGQHQTEHFCHVWIQSLDESCVHFSKMASFMKSYHLVYWQWLSLQKPLFFESNLQITLLWLICSFHIGMARYYCFEPYTLSSVTVNGHIK